MVPVLGVAITAVCKGGYGRSRRDGPRIFGRNRIPFFPLRRMRKLRDHRPHQRDALFHIARIDIRRLKPARRSLVLGGLLEDFFRAQFRDIALRFRVPGTRPACLRRGELSARRARTKMMRIELRQFAFGKKMLHYLRRGGAVLKHRGGLAHPRARAFVRQGGKLQLRENDRSERMIALVQCLGERRQPMHPRAEIDGNFVPGREDALQLTSWQGREIAEIILRQKRRAIANERPTLAETRMQPFPAGQLEFPN
jgi:hypothetical protein